MGRLLAPVLCAVALVLAAGCGGGEEGAPAPETVEGTVPTETQGETGAGEDGGGDGEAQGDAAAGKEIYASAGCGNCHAFADAGSTAAVGPSLDESSIDFEGAVQQIANGGGGMPAFSGQLSEEDIRNVAAYIVEARS